MAGASLGTPDRADWLLALIASPLLIAAALAPVLSVPLSYALGIGAIPASGGLGYALFGFGAGTN